MTETEFFYWIQGAFELVPGFSPDKRQAECIVRHAKLVRAVVPDPGIAFCRVESLAYALADGEREASIHTEMVDRLRSTVASMFANVIDPSAGAPEQQAKLNEIHGFGEPGRPGWRDPITGKVLRC